MAETAKILSPGKKVIMPDRRAGCPMADMITAEQLRDLKQKHPDALVVCYVNSTADVKAESDYCCTSANAVEVVNSLPHNRQVIFVPDQHLGRFVEEKTGRELILWPGYCPTHAFIGEDDVRKAKQEYPAAVVMAHPECSEPVKHMADALLSTGQMIKFVQNSPAKRFIVATEVGILHRLRRENPGRTFYAANERASCAYMKVTTLPKVQDSLERLQHHITVPPDIAQRARRAIERMVAIGGSNPAPLLPGEVDPGE